MNIREKIVFCIDDGKSISIIFRFMFKDRAKYKAIIFDNALDALKYMKDNPVDMFIANYIMEPMDGL